MSIVESSSPKILPLVSIGVPLYNGANTLNEALSSLRNQTYQNLEIIVSDDCSTDTSREIYTQHMLEDTRVKSFRQAVNIGAVDNFNFVLDKSSGQYFFWHAQDDIRASRYVEKCIEQFQRNSELVFCHSIYTDFLDSISESHDLKSLSLMSQKRMCERFLDAYRSRIGSTAFYGMFNLSRVKSKMHWGNYNGSDIAIFQSILLQGPIFEVPEVLFYYRRKNKVRDKREHHRFLKKTNKTPLIYLPGVILLANIINIIVKSGITKNQKTYLVIHLLWWEGLTNSILLLYKLIAKLFGRSAGYCFLQWLRRTDIQPMNVGYKD